MNGPAIVVLTEQGAALARHIIAGLGEAEIVYAVAAVRPKLTELFQAGRPLVCVMALGIVVRIVGPLAHDKETDPPVVVVDEAGRFAISVLSGHAGGANQLAQRVAQALGAIPVITTASDALGLPALDMLGKEWGWKLEGRENLTRVMAAMIRGERIALYQQAGRPLDWPACFQPVSTWPIQGYWAAAVAISDLSLPALDAYPTLLYRPPSLVLGVGCKRGVPCDEIEAMFQQVCRTHGFASLSLGLVATIVLKSDEPGLIQFAARHGVPLKSFSLEAIAEQVDIPTPSQKVKEKIGVSGVAEPSAMLGAGVKQLLITKQTGQRVTMALARR